MPEEAIEVRGARVNNLKNISFSIPINQLTVVTGVSGSGKSSLAFDTIYAEGQRRYVESLSAYARQFLERMDKPDVDEVRGIAPAIAIRQKNSTRNPRSTVGTQTEVFDYLRLLYARVGVTYCRICGREVYKDSPESVADEILRTLPEGTRFFVLFPAHAGLTNSDAENGRNGDAAKQRKKSPRPRASGSPRQGSDASRQTTATPRQVITAHVMSLMQRGFTRLYSSGQIIELNSPDDYQLDTFDDVFVMVDRLVARADIRQRLVDSLEICFQEGHGTANIETAAGSGGSPTVREVLGSSPTVREGLGSSPTVREGLGGSPTVRESPGGSPTVREGPDADISAEPSLTVGLLPVRLKFSDRFECKYDGTIYAQPEPRLFSFNNPYGACRTCQGFGNTIGLDLDLVIPNPGLSLKEGAIEPWTKPQHEWAFDELKQFVGSPGTELEFAL